VRDRDFVGLTNSTALQVHIAKHAARLGVRLKFRARLRDFDAICQMVAADVGIAVVPETAAKRCARSMPIMMIRIRDPWANRKLTICARSFKTLPRPAKLLVEHLRKAAQR
jgi:DNA-binding transcriptional LysR family regulator